MADAFRFFDTNGNKKLSFLEFYSGLDRLKIKMSDAEALRCFNYLNTKEDGGIDYNQFCSLAEERRRGLDPFGQQPPLPAPPVPDSEKPDHAHKLYFSDIHTEDLHKVLKVQ
jgi:hypothetical protein